MHTSTIVIAIVIKNSNDNEKSVNKQQKAWDLWAKKSVLPAEPFELGHVIIISHFTFGKLSLSLACFLMALCVQLV